MAKNTSAQADLLFRERVAALGGTVVEPAWLGNAQRHRIVCGQGHEWAVRPSAISQGVGICRVCAGNDPATAERNFREAVQRAGARIVEPTWLGALRPHRIICGEGHESAPRPNDVQQRGTICAPCTGFVSPEEAWRQFRDNVAKLGGVLLETAWLGKDRPHRARCAAGHSCTPLPCSLRIGRGMCLICAGQDSGLAEQRFRDRVAEFGGTVVEDTWLGNGVPHRVRCAKGHLSRPRPASIQQGTGICRYCKGQTWDAFYVVTDPVRGHLKFGITSGNAKYRLRVHARDGFVIANLLLTGMTGTAAPDLEKTVKAALRLAGESPVRGAEYFDSAALGLVLDVAPSTLAEFSSGAGGIVGYARP